MLMSFVDVNKPFLKLKLKNKQAMQGKRAFFALSNKIRVLRLPDDLALELFDYLVIPVLLYGFTTITSRFFNQSILHMTYIIMGSRFSADDIVR